MQLSCPVCLHPHFDDVDTLRITLIAVSTSDITCPMCPEVLKGLDKFTIHLFTHANPSKECNNIENNKREDVENLQTNELQTSSLTEVAVGIEEEITNAQIVLANEQRTIRCDICNFTFSDENILDMHQKLLHQTLEDKDTGLYSYHCHLCSKKFKMKGSLMVHLRVAHYGFGHNKGDDLVDTLTKLKKSDDGKSDEPTKKWSCDVCNKLFTTKYFLKKHKRLHTGEMPYFCAQCNKYFTFQQSYRKHMLYHSSEKPHVCAECGRAFKELSTLHNHERIHSGERPFACETCGKCFRQRVSYLVHKRIHTGAMPYKCTACGKTFRYKVSQRSHKCPNPPGDVVKTETENTTLLKSTQNTNSSTTSTIALSNLNLNANEKLDGCNISQTLGLNNNLLTQELGHNVNIVFNAEGQIIGQNFTFDGQNLITFANSFQLTSKTTENEQINKEENVVNVTKDNLSNNSVVIENSDFYSMVMSSEQNILLADENKSQDDSSNNDKPIQLQTINEESLKQLIYGSSLNK